MEKEHDLNQTSVFGIQNVHFLGYNLLTTLKLEHGTPSYKYLQPAAVITYKKDLQPNYRPFAFLIRPRDHQLIPLKYTNTFLL